ncbi:uncharacterized protein LOC141713041 [Apium graveolens]|uniref:uncharacterized protein LOC141713041 n=1 Tax=Apium graveolens TaxID=4045 RepID=UPI003D7A5B07
MQIALSSLLHQPSLHNHLQSTIAVKPFFGHASRHHYNPNKALEHNLFIKSKTVSLNVSLSVSTPASDTRIQVTDIKKSSVKWEWKGHSVNYFVYKNPQESLNSSPPPVLLVHGFGASIPHWRNNIKVIAENRDVYAIDLLGFGDSDKPVGYQYTMEKWAELILDFVDQIVKEPTVLIGNSVGSLACVIAASEASSSAKSSIKGLVLLNCAGGMNNKAIVDDWRIKLLFPLLWLIDFLLNQRWIASFIFERVKQKESLKNILSSVYSNKESVDDELVEIIKNPAEGEGALDAFVAIVTGPPGPNPVQLMPKITIPVLILWGDDDPFTPLDGPIGNYFSSLPTSHGSDNVSLFVLEGVGHCPHDDRPELVHEKLLPWLALLPA